MINGLYSATTGMYVQQIRLDVISSNIANASVPGFKGERIVFRSFPTLDRNEAPQPGARPEELGPLGGGATLDEITTDFSPGPMIHTNQDEDLAIFGEGFFHMETPTGERLTRNGSFARDSEGFLRNSDGNLLLGQQGPIQVPESRFHINEDGEVFVERQTSLPGGRVETRTVTIDRIRLSRVEDPTQLERQGNSMYFLPTGNEQAMEPGTSRIGQGYLEMANIQAIQESVQMVDTFRNYEASQRLVLAMDELLDQAINEVGRV